MYLVRLMIAFVYIIKSKKTNAFYIGETDDLENRIHWHNNLKLNTNTTKSGIPWEFFYTINCESRSQARKIEKHLKRMKSRKYLINLRKYPEISMKLLEKYKSSDHRFPR